MSKSTLFVSLRYLRTRAISYIATFVCALGVGVLVFVTSVMGGFQREYHRRIRGTFSDISVDPRNFFGITNGDELMKKIREVPHVAAVAPFIDNLVFIDTHISQTYGYVKGIDPRLEPDVSELDDFILAPRQIYELLYPKEPELVELFGAGAAREKPHLADALAKPVRVENTDLPGAIVGFQLFKSLKMELGDVLTLITTSKIKRKIEDKDVQERRFEVRGAFKVGIYDQDNRFIYTDIAAAQDLIGVPGRLQGINVKLDDYTRAEQVAPAIQAHLANPSLQARTWFQQHEPLMKAVATEQFLIYLVIFFMILLAGLNLTAILTMSVVEKTKDLGILKAVGATRGSAMAIFLWQGLIITTLGSVLGLGLGLLGLDRANWLDREVIEPLAGRRVFDPKIYSLDEIPTETSVAGILICVLPPIGLGLLLALYPAYRAARLDPIEALRYE